MSKKNSAPADPSGPSPDDPFGEFAGKIFRTRQWLLGGQFEFECDSRRLQRVVETAYAGVPPHRLTTATPRFRLTLRLTNGARSVFGREPPQARTFGGPQLLCGIVDAENFAVLCPAQRTGMVAVSRAMLRFPYHARYELLEFAVFTLASRALGLAPLHAGCVGLRDNGVLLIGESGAGKSTLALQCLLQDMELLAEDAVFVEPRTLAATGVANFLHLRADAASARLADSTSVAAHIRRSPVIRRRSGVAKFEVDVRRRPFRLAARPQEIVGVMFLSNQSAKGSAILTPLNRTEMLARLAASQPYAAQLPTWKQFTRNLSRAAAFEMRRGRDPREAADALKRLLT